MTALAAMLVLADNLATWIETFRARLESGELQGDVCRRAERLLDEDDFFRYTADTRRMPEAWDPLRRRLAAELRALRDGLERTVSDAN